MLNFIDFFIIGLAFLLILKKSAEGFLKYSSVYAYTIGTKTFSNKYLIGTIIATWISSSMMSSDLSKSYSFGLYFFIPACCMSISIMVIGWIVIPRCKEFMESTTIAEALGDIYGNYVKKITAILSLFFTTSLITTQIMSVTFIICYFLNTDAPTIKIIVSLTFTVFIIMYSYLGGIVSVVKTDLVQIIIGLIAIGSILFFYVFNKDFVHIDTSLPQFRNYDFYHVMTTWNSDFKKMLLLAFYFTFPSIAPVDFQRISMAFSLKQAKICWLISAFSILSITIAMCFLGYIVLCINPSLQQNEILGYFTKILLPNGVKGIFFIAILCLAMSTIDSYLNISAAIVANDIFSSQNNNTKKMNIAKISVISIGLFCFCVSHIEGDILRITMYLLDFYTPIVSTLFFATVFNFRASKLVTLTSMISTLTCVSSLKIINYLYKTDINVLLPSTLFFVFVYTSMYYIIDKWLKPIGITSQLNK